MVVKVYRNGLFVWERAFDSVREANDYAAEKLAKGHTVEMTSW